MASWKLDKMKGTARIFRLAGSYMVEQQQLQWVAVMMKRSDTEGGSREAMTRCRWMDGVKCKALFKYPPQAPTAKLSATEHWDGVLGRAKRMSEE